MLVLRALLIHLITIAAAFVPVASANQLPSNAYKYLPMLLKEQRQFIPNFFERAYPAALIEHESCVTLTSPRCWSPVSELKTSREQGVGFGQITRAWKNGKLRFDTLAELKAEYKTHLADLNWSNIKTKPDLQLRAITLKLMKLDNTLSYIPKQERLAFIDAAYNGGLGDMNSDRRLCSMKRDCDPNKWFGHVEKQSVKPRSVLYGNRSAYDINRHHVRDVLLTRMPKYQQYLEANPIDHPPVKIPTEPAQNCVCK